MIRCLQERLGENRKEQERTYTLCTHSVSEKTSVREREILEVSVKHVSGCYRFSEKLNVLPGNKKERLP